MSNIKNVAMITVCGRPNVGKSSLTNALVGEKVAIVSNKAQTTRNRIYGVVNREDTQYILLDTPGLHRPKSALGDYMVKVVTSSLSDVDCALLLVEPIPHVGGPEQALIDRVREEKLPCILCINKIDTVEPAELLPVIAAYSEVWDGFDAIIPISAHTGSGLDDLMHELHKYAQEGPQLFPDGVTSDQPERQVMGEILREKAAAVPGQGDPPRHGGGDHQILRAGLRRHRRGRHHLLREVQPQGHHHRQAGGHAEKDQLPGPPGHGEVHGHQGVSGDLGEGEGKLAG